jgi:hypothetical protein
MELGTPLQGSMDGTIPIGFVRTCLPHWSFSSGAWAPEWLLLCCFADLGKCWHLEPCTLGISVSFPRSGEAQVACVQ